MHEEDSGVPNGLVAPCGHRNPPSAHFCDVCGATLPMQCPRCHAINRRQAHFCNMCGLSLSDLPRTQATPSIVPLEPSPGSSRETEPDSAPAPPLALERRPTNEGLEGPESPDPPRWPAGSGRELVAAEPDERERLGQLQQFLRRRRRSRRARLRLGIVSVTVVVGFLGAALVRTHFATPSAAPPFIDTDAKAPIAAQAEESVSAAVAHRPPARTGPPIRLSGRITARAHRLLARPRSPWPSLRPSVAPAAR
jgi:hypothetical protein